MVLYQVGAQIDVIIYIKKLDAGVEECPDEALECKH